MTARNERMSERLKAVRLHFGLTQTVMASQMGVGYRSYQNYETNEREPKVSDVAGLVTMGVNLNWLLTGTGEMLITPVDENLSPAVPKLLDNYEFSAALAALERQTVPLRAAAPLDEELAALIADGISKAYKEVNARLSPADLGRLTARMMGDALAFRDASQRPAFVAGALATLRRELRRPHDGSPQDKRLA